MKKLYFLIGAVLMVLRVCAEQKPKADVFLRVTSELPMFCTGHCSGIFTVTNTGHVPFVVITDTNRVGNMVRFYRSYEGERQRIEDEHWNISRNIREREVVLSDYHFWLNKKVKSKTLQPGETVMIECPFFVFEDSGMSGGDICKAEMILGSDTWVPVCITPPVGFFLPANHLNQNIDGEFYYAKEGTNLYLYLKTDGKFKRTGEMKLDSKPKQQGDVVTFTSPEGVQKQLNLMDAVQAIRRREIRDIQTEKGSVP